MLTATLLHSPQDKEPGQATGAAARSPAHTGGGGGAQDFERTDSNDDGTAQLHRRPRLPIFSLPARGGPP